MCNACGFFCCGSDMMGQCGCDDCEDSRCWGVCDECVCDECGEFEDDCVCDDDYVDAESHE